MTPKLLSDLELNLDLGLRFNLNSTKTLKNVKIGYLKSRNYSGEIATPITNMPSFSSKVVTNDNLLSLTM